MPIDLPAKSRIIVALDTQEVPVATNLVKLLAPHVGMFKVGLELTEAVGTPRAIRAIKVVSGKVFRDGKFLDIPATVRKASQAVAGHEPSFFNLHIQSGEAAMRAAVANKGKSRVLGVSILTSMDPYEIMEMFVAPFVAMTGESFDYEYFMTISGEKEDIEAAKERRAEYVKKLVLGMAEKAALCGLDGLICSPQELPYQKQHGSPAVRALLKVVPGVRMSEDSVDDQTRVGTPYQAIIDGADYLVIGRPILEAADPVAAAQAYAAEIDRALRDLARAA